MPLHLLATWGFGMTGLSLEEQVNAEYCHRPEGFLSVLGGNYDWDWTPYIAWCEAPYLKKSPKASGLLFPAERGRAFLQEQEPSTIHAERNLETF